MATDSPIFQNNNHNNKDTSFSTEDDAFASQLISKIYADEAIDKDFDGGFLDRMVQFRPLPMEMEPEESFTLKEERLE